MLFCQIDLMTRSRQNFVRRLKAFWVRKLLYYVSLHYLSFYSIVLLYSICVIVLTLNYCYSDIYINCHIHIFQKIKTNYVL